MNTNNESIFNYNALQVPFVILEISNVQLGLVSANSDMNATLPSLDRPTTPTSLGKYPNLISSLEVKKISGAYNSYNIVLKYKPEEGEDANFIDKLLAYNFANNGSHFKIAYGDSQLPYEGGQTNVTEFQSALITKYKMKFDLHAGVFVYNLAGISIPQALSPDDTNYSTVIFPPRVSNTPISLIIKSVYNNSSYGLKNILRDIVIEGISINDITSEYHPDIDIESIEIPRATYTPLQYILYLISNKMISKSDGSTTSSGLYTYVFDDEVSDSSDLPRLVVDLAHSPSNKTPIAELVIGGGGVGSQVIRDIEFVGDFSPAIYVGYKFDFDSHTEYRVDDNGEYYSIKVNGLSYTQDETQLIHDKLFNYELASYPYILKLTTVGVIKPVKLLDTININIISTSGLHYSSGTYSILETVDRISESGYLSSFKLMRTKSLLSDDMFTEKELNAIYTMNSITTVEKYNKILSDLHNYIVNNIAVIIRGIENELSDPDITEDERKQLTKELNEYNKTLEGQINNLLNVCLDIHMLDYPELSDKRNTVEYLYESSERGKIEYLTNLSLSDPPLDKYNWVAISNEFYEIKSKNIKAREEQLEKGETT